MVKRVRLKRGIAMLLCCFLLAGALIPTVRAESAESPILSYGLQILSANTDVAVAAPVGNEVTFSADLFARGLNLSSVEFITVRSLPPVTDGELLMGSTRVAVGQSISAANMGYMVFSAASDDVRHSSFSFTANGGNVPMVCSVYLLPTSNYTPTVSMASDLSLNVSTYKGLSAYGTLSAYDPDGDELIFEVVSYPTKGALRLVDRKLGTYIYKPQSSYVGSDSFTYVARDKYGNYSASATVQLRVTQSGTSVTYADMEASQGYNAALAMTESGVMSGTQVGNRYYFYPDQTVSRVEFLVMAMNATGITEVPDCLNTNFADDADIPSTMKGYVAAAYSLGYISGSNVQGELCFLPNEEITRAQAAVMLANILGLSEVAVTPTFADAGDIPVWAKDAIYSLHAAGILVSEDGAVTPTAKLTREQTACLLSAAKTYSEKD